MNIAKSANHNLQHGLLARAEVQQSRAVFLVGILINHARTVKEQENFVQSMAMIGVKMGILGDPFRLFGRLLVAGFKITGYTVTFIVQVVWYLFHRHHDIGLAFGDFERAVTNAIGDVFSD